MIDVPTLPGLYYQQVPQCVQPSPLRSDVAGFIGRTCRGPVGTPVRVEGFEEYRHHFGGLSSQRSFPYSIRGYFENEGRVAHVVRVHPDDPRYARADWLLAERVQEGPDKGKLQQDFPTSGGFRAARYEIHATSPGTWASGLRVFIRYELNGPTRTPIVSMTVTCEGEPTEHIRQLVPGATEPGKTLEELVAKQSRLIRVKASDESNDRLTDEDGNPLVELPDPPGPQSKTWELTLQLAGDSDSRSGDSVAQEYKRAIRLLGDQTEVAILATPSIYEDLPRPDSRRNVFQAMIDEAVETQDRLVVIDAPPSPADTEERITSSELIAFVRQLQDDNSSPISRRAAAVYHPWLRVNDPLGDVRQPLRAVPPSGHVAGVMSRIDRERGAHHTPANVPILDAIDVETLFDRGAGGPLNEAGVNLIRCLPGKGLMVWGGRTLDLSRDGRFVAHRRFIHRLIRAIRNVADPVVFDTNGPELWLILVRGVSTVLLEAFRGGALRGERPEEAFRVRCDEQTNPLSQREEGRVSCEIGLALAAPMEFITIRVSVSIEGQVEVFDA